jgi:hypothetical protein
LRATALFAVLAIWAVSGRAGAAVPDRRNISPRPSFHAVCATHGGLSQPCIDQTVAAIENARSQETMRKSAFILPDNYRRLSRAEQAFVVVDLERVDRGVRPLLGMVASLNMAAQASAEAQADPHPATYTFQKLGVHTYRSVWGRDYGVLAVDYDWMYYDGYSAANPATNVNAVCAMPGASGCWSHRAAILDPFEGQPLLEAGAGGANGLSGTDSATVILTGGSGSRPAYTYTWRQALAHGADGHRLSHRRHHSVAR